MCVCGREIENHLVESFVGQNLHTFSGEGVLEDKIRTHSHANYFSEV